MNKIWIKTLCHVITCMRAYDFAISYAVHILFVFHAVFLLHSYIIRICIFIHCYLFIFYSINSYLKNSNLFTKIIIYINKILLFDSLFFSYFYFNFIMIYYDLLWFIHIFRKWMLVLTYFWIIIVKWRFFACVLHINSHSAHILFIFYSLFTHRPPPSKSLYSAL